MTPSQLIDVVEARLKEVEPSINAIPINCFERARKAAKELKVPAQPPRGYLYGLDLPTPMHPSLRLHEDWLTAAVAAGLPIVVKDSAAVKGVRWTQVWLFVLLRPPPGMEDLA